MICALIFDFDGLIVDTESPALESWRLIYAEHGHELSLDEWAGALGTNHGFDAMAHLAGLVASSDSERAARLLAEATAIIARRQQLKAELSAAQSVLPGVHELLAAAAERDMPCAVASSSSRAWVGGWLERLGIAGRFRCVRTSDDVTRTKPDPELFLSAAACLGLPPACCLVLEDSPNGILAARAAGCPVVAVPGTVTAQLSLPPADLLIPSLAAMPLDAILAAVAAAKTARSELPAG